MSEVKSALAFVEALYRALKFLQLYPADDPRCRQALDAVEAANHHLFVTEGHVVLEVSSPVPRLFCNGQPVDARVQATAGLLHLLKDRRIQRLSFGTEVDDDDFQLLYFLLQLSPQRLAELGGAATFGAQFSAVQVVEAPAPARRPAAEEAPAPLPPPPAPAGPSLADALRLRFAPLGLDAKPAASSLALGPWSGDQQEMLQRCMLPVADLSTLVGLSEELNLNQTDPITLRDALRQALALLPPVAQGAILLGIARTPGTEQPLRRALDYLAPEFLAQTAADAHAKLGLPRAQFALLVAALLQCVKDRELSLEALRGRLQFEGWGLPDLDDLCAAIQWECQGTDTKLREAIDELGVLAMGPSQVIGLVRQALRHGQPEALTRLLAPVETGLFSPGLLDRRQAAHLVASLADCLEDPGLPDDVHAKLLDLLHAHLNQEQDPEALQWSGQAMEALLSHALSRGQFAEAYRIVLALLDLANAHAGSPDLAWKAQAIHDTLTRLAGPLNMAALVPLLHQRRGELSTHQVHALLAVMGQPAARYLTVCLGIEEDRTRRGHLLDALRAIGPRGAAPLREALAAPEWYLVRNAILLIGEVRDRESFEQVAYGLTHRDVRVRKAAVKTLPLLDPYEAASVLAQCLASADPGLKLELLGALADVKDPRTVHLIAEQLTSARNSGEEGERIRLRAVESLGAIASPEAIPALSRIFKKRGLLQGKESLGMRLAAARALAAIGNREAREAMALAIEDETREEVRSILRQFLVSGP